MSVFIKVSETRGDFVVASGNLDRLLHIEDKVPDQLEQARIMRNTWRIRLIHAFIKFGKYKFATFGAIKNSFHANSRSSYSAADVEYLFTKGLLVRRKKRKNLFEYMLCRDHERDYAKIIDL